MQGTLEAIRAKCTEEGDCWLWNGALSHGTTPTMRIDGDKHQVSVRRYVLELQGKKVDGLKATNTCNDPRCVCPAHAVAWPTSRMLKRVAVTSGYGLCPARNAKIAAGKRQHSPVTPELVTEIRNSPESGHAIARRLGLSQSTVQAIRAHETWKDYSNPFFQLAA